MKKNNVQTMKTMGANLKAARVAEKVSQSYVAELLGHFTTGGKPDANAISGLELGKRMVTQKELDALCDCFKKTPEYFFPDGVPQLRAENKKRGPKQPKAQKPTPAPKPSPTEILKIANSAGILKEVAITTIGDDKKKPVEQPTPQPQQPVQPEVKVEEPKPVEIVCTNPELVPEMDIVIEPNGTKRITLKWVRV